MKRVPFFLALALDIIAFVMLTQSVLGLIH